MKNILIEEYNGDLEKIFLFNEKEMAIKFMADFFVKTYKEDMENELLPNIYKALMKLYNAGKYDIFTDEIIINYVNKYDPKTILYYYDDDYIINMEN